MPPVMAKDPTGQARKAPSMIRSSKQHSPHSIRLRPIMASTSGVTALVAIVTGSTVAEAKALDHSPAHISAAAV